MHAVQVITFIYHLVTSITPLLKVLYANFHEEMCDFCTIHKNHKYLDMEFE